MNLALSIDNFTIDIISILVHLKFNTSKVFKSPFNFSWLIYDRLNLKCPTPVQILKNLLNVKR